jgi:hypothetical protein
MSRCLSVCVIRLDDRRVLVRYDANAADAPAVVAPAQSADGSAAPVPAVPVALPRFDLGDLSSVAQKVAAASVNRTRLQLDLLDTAVTHLAAQLAAPTAGAAAQQPSAACIAPPGTQIHAVVSRPKNIAVAAVCTREASPRTVFVLGDTALAQFERMFLERASSLTAEQCGAAFRDTLRDAVVKFNATMAQMGVGGEDDRIQKVKRAVEDTKSAVLENIDRALDRGGKIESIVDASAELSENAQTFEGLSRQVERTLWWQAMRMKLAVGAVVIAVVLIVIAMTCGKKCFGLERKASNVAPPVPAPLPKPPAPEVPQRRKAAVRF